MFHMAGQTAGPIETKLDTRTHVHPGSVSVKVIHVCVQEWQNYETPGMLRESNTWRTLTKLRTARVTRRGAAGAEQQARVELRLEDG